MKCISILLVALLLCQLGSSRITDGARTPPTANLGGANFLGMAINAKNASLHFTWPVSDFTYAMGNTWTSPISGKTYSVPDQMHLTPFVNSETAIVETASSNFSTAFDACFSGWSISAGLTYPKLFSIGFQFNRQVEDIHVMMKERSQMVGLSSYWQSYYQMEMMPTFALSPGADFQFFVSKLPTDVNTPGHVQLYQEFVEQVGTHYLCWGMFGGSVNLDTFISSDITKKFSLDQVTQQMGLEFHYWLFNISAGHYSNRTQIKFDNWFASKQQTYMYWTGGAYQTNATVSLWLTTLADLPGVLNATLCPLSELVETWDPVRASLLETFVTEYLSS